MRFKDYLYLGLAVVIGLFGLLMVLGASMNWSEGEDQMSDLALGIGLGALPLTFAVWWIRSTLRGSRRRQHEELERQVLELASASGGRLTPAQVAQSTDLTLQESKDFLDRLGIEGYCRMDLSDEGVLSYHFTS